MVGPKAILWLHGLIVVTKKAGIFLGLEPVDENHGLEGGGGCLFVYIEKIVNMFTFSTFPPNPWFPKLALPTH